MSVRVSGCVVEWKGGKEGQGYVVEWEDEREGE